MSETNHETSQAPDQSVVQLPLTREQAKALKRGKLFLVPKIRDGFTKNERFVLEICTDEEHAAKSSSLGFVWLARIEQVAIEEYEIPSMEKRKRLVRRTGVHVE